MPRQIIRTLDAPSSPLFSQAVKVGPMLYLSGMTGLDPKTKQMAGDTIEAQTHQAIENCRAILAAGGATLDDVTSVLVLLARPADFARKNEAYGKAFPTDPPARAVSRLGPDLSGVLVSIVMTAVGTA